MLAIAGFEVAAEMLLERQSKNRRSGNGKDTIPHPPTAPSFVTPLASQNTSFLNGALRPLFSSLIGLFGEFVLLLTAEGKIVSLSSSTRPSATDSRETFVGRPISSLLRNGDFPLLEAAMRRVLAYGYREYSEHHIELPLGPRWFRSSVVPLSRLNGAAKVVAVFTEDVTSTKDAHQNLHTNQTLLQQAESLARMGSFHLDLLTYALTWSEQLYRNLGLDPHRGITWQSFLNLVHQDDRSRFLREMERSIAFRSALDSEFRCVLNNGDVRVFHGHAIPLHDDTGVPLALVGIYHDVTERKLAEERLHNREALLAQAEQLAELGSWEWDLETSRVTWSDHRYRLFGLDPHSQPPTIDRFWSHVHPDDRDRVRALFQDSIDHGSPLEYEARFVLADGRIRTLHTRGVPFRNLQGRTIRLAGMAQDVTQRRSEEQRLRRSEALLAQAEEIANVGSWEYDVKSSSTILSRQLLRMYGVASQEEWTIDHFWTHTLLPDSNSVRLSCQQAIRRCEPFEFTTRYRLPDGTVRVYHLVGKPIPGSDGSAERVLGVVRDITDYTNIEDQLRRLSQQLIRTRDSERRQLARELHESAGQSLAALKMSLGNLEEVLAADHAAALSHLNEARGFAEDAIREVRVISYLMYPPLLDEAGLGPALRWYVRGFSERSGIDATIEIVNGFKRFPQEIESAIFSVVQEALTNVHRYSGSPTVVVRVSCDRGSIRAEIEDCGCGLPASGFLSRKNSPFGVGIPGMRERVNQLNGSFEVLSTPGRGTLVRAVLPVSVPQELSPASNPH